MHKVVGSPTLGVSSESLGLSKLSAALYKLKLPSPSPAPPHACALSVAVLCPDAHLRVGAAACATPSVGVAGAAVDQRERVQRRVLLGRDVHGVLALDGLALLVGGHPHRSLMYCASV